MAETPELRWFEEFPKCSCGKNSQGILRGSRNDSYGHHCKRCAERRLKDSKREREREKNQREEYREEAWASKPLV